MRDQFKPIIRSLGFRLLIPLSVTVAAILAAHANFSFESTKEDFLRLVQSDVVRYSGLIMRATRDGMLLNNKEEVQATIERLAEGPEIAAIRVYDKEGAIVMSAERDEIGRLIGRSSAICHSCHRRTETTDDALLELQGLAREGNGLEVLRHLSVIQNQPNCTTAACHAHPADQRVLGVLDLEMSMAPLDATIDRTRRQFLWTTLILIVVIGAISALFIQHVVHRPVVQLYKGTQRIAEGDLTTRVEVWGHHELAQLAKAFNRMAEDLSTARCEVTEWSQKLEDKVIEKTEELSRTQGQVLQMEKMASLGKLSATVAHELNNPLSGVLTYARLVRRELDEQPIPIEERDELRRYLILIEKECARCGAIVQNLLVFARRSSVDMAAVDLNEVVERSLMLVRHHLEISGVSLRCKLLDSNSVIVGDGGQLQQALMALLVNAIEAMTDLDNQEGELKVELTATEDEVQIDVADTGVGIAAEVLPQIFDPFFSTKKAENGVGLGLSVVYGIIERHGGRIDVESAVGRGAIFHVHLPRRADPSDDRATALTRGGEASA